jgi:DNA-binding GntR family transcriptional regulator
MQQELCEAMDISNTTLRKALKALRAEEFDPN